MSFPQINLTANELRELREKYKEQTFERFLCRVAANMNNARMKAALLEAVGGPRPNQCLGRRLEDVMGIPFSDDSSKGRHLRFDWLDHEIARVEAQDRSIQKCVAHGVKWLDEHYPDWLERAKGMNISSCDDDVLCRAAGYDNFDAALTDHDIEDPMYYGFDAPHSFNELQAEWDRVIEERLKTKSTPVAAASHPFDINSDGSVSYGSDTMQGSEVLALIARLRESINIEHPGSYGGFNVSYDEVNIEKINIGCQRFNMDEIEAFIEDYEARQKEKPGERTVKIGDIVSIPGCGDYIVASVPDTEAILISLERGSRWSGTAKMLGDGSAGYALSDLLDNSHCAYSAMNRITVKPRA